MRVQSLSLLRTLLLAHGLAAALALVGALVFQYVVNLPPCHFCLLQRYPYGAVAGLSLVALLACRGRTVARQAAAVVGVAWLNAGLFLASAGIAAWHSGVERGWWTSGSGCTSVVGGTTPEEVLASLLAAPVVRCDEIPWDVLGLSLANLNVIYGLGAAAVSVWALIRIPRS